MYGYGITRALIQPKHRPKKMALSNLKFDNRWLLMNQFNVNSHCKYMGGWQAGKTYLFCITEQRYFKALL